MHGLGSPQTGDVGFVEALNKLSKRSVWKVGSTSRVRLCIPSLTIMFLAYSMKFSCLYKLCIELICQIETGIKQIQHKLNS